MIVDRRSYLFIFLFLTHIGSLHGIDSVPPNFSPTQVLPTIPSPVSTETIEKIVAQTSETVADVFLKAFAGTSGQIVPYVMMGVMGIYGLKFIIEKTGLSNWFNMGSRTAETHEVVQSLNTKADTLTKKADATYSIVNGTQQTAGDIQKTVNKVQKSVGDVSTRVVALNVKTEAIAEQADTINRRTNDIGKELGLLHEAVNETKETTTCIGDTLEQLNKELNAVKQAVQEQGNAGLESQKDTNQKIAEMQESLKVLQQTINVLPEQLSKQQSSIFEQIKLFQASISAIQEQVKKNETALKFLKTRAKIKDLARDRAIKMELNALPSISNNEQVPVAEMVAETDSTGANSNMPRESKQAVLRQSQQPQPPIDSLAQRLGNISPSQGSPIVIPPSSQQAKYDDELYAILSDSWDLNSNNEMRKVIKEELEEYKKEQSERMESLIANATKKAKQEYRVAQLVIEENANLRKKLEETTGKMCACLCLMALSCQARQPVEVTDSVASLFPKKVISYEAPQYAQPLSFRDSAFMFIPGTSTKL